jgi:hypothetical protein
MTRTTVARVGLLSCVLFGCDGDGSAAPNGGTRDGPRILSENTAALCKDGLDNDDDGFIDCEDHRAAP